MEVKAIGKYVRVQPRKVRIIADEVRGANAPHTVALLRYHTSKSAKALRKVLVSAMANAVENHGLSADQLKIAAITVDEGPRQKRMRARAMGRGNRIIKKTSHITVVVEEAEAVAKVKPHGTKAKPRPTFAAPKKGKAAAKPAAAEVVEETVVAPVEAAVEVAPEIEASVPESAEEQAVEAAEAEGLPAEEPVSEEPAAEAAEGETN
jgi:large subunit ribosomal protein L22